MRLAGLHRRVGKGAQAGALGSILSCAFAHAHTPALFFVDVGTALYEILGDRYISGRAFAHPTRCALSRMMELS
jgi:hypothetical protein